MPKVRFLPKSPDFNLTSLTIYLPCQFSRHPSSQTCHGSRKWTLKSILAWTSIVLRQTAHVLFYDDCLLDRMSYFRMQRIPSPHTASLGSSDSLRFLPTKRRCSHTILAAFSNIDLCIALPFFLKQSRLYRSGMVKILILDDLSFPEFGLDDRHMPSAKQTSQSRVQNSRWNSDIKLNPGRGGPRSCPSHSHLFVPQTQSLSLRDPIGLVFRYSPNLVS